MLQRFSHRIQVHPIVNTEFIDENTANTTRPEPKQRNKNKQWIHVYSWMFLLMFALFVILLYWAKSYEDRAYLGRAKDDSPK